MPPVGNVSAGGGPPEVSPARPEVALGPAPAGAVAAVLVPLVAAAALAVVVPFGCPVMVAVAMVAKAMIPAAAAAVRDVFSDAAI